MENNQPPIPEWMKNSEKYEIYIGGMKFDRRVLERCVDAAEESGIDDPNLLKQTAFIQICMDVLDVNNTEYSILAITNYDSSEINQLWLQKFNALKTNS